MLEDIAQLTDAPVPASIEHVDTAAGRAIDSDGHQCAHAEAYRQLRTNVGLSFDRRPSMADRMGLDSQLGLLDVLTGRGSLKDLTTDVDSHLAVLPAGTVSPIPSELLGSEAMAHLLTTHPRGNSAIPITLASGKQPPVSGAARCSSLD